MKTSGFRFTKEFDNVFAMMNFCYKKGLTNDNSILERSEKDEDIYILYYN